MSPNQPTSDMSLPEAPSWARDGVARFHALEGEGSTGMGAGVSAYRMHGAARYYPNLSQALGAGVYAALLAGLSLVSFVVVAVVQLAQTEAVAAWTYVAIATSGAAIALSFARVVSAERPPSLRHDGLYLLPEGLVLVREGRCACHRREELARFRALGDDEGVELTDGVTILLARGEHEALRDEWERWRTRDATARPPRPRGFGPNVTT